MGSLSPVHWLIVLVVVLLVFGPARLAHVGKGLGEGIRNFKRGLDDAPDKEAEDEDDGEAAEQLPPARDAATPKRVSRRNA